MQQSATLDDITDAVLGASRVLVAIAARSLAAVAEDVTLPQFRALVVLQSRGPQSAQALGSELGIGASSVTRLCDRLVAKGLIEREPVPWNRRVVQLSVTPEGAGIVASVSRRRRKEIRRIVEKLSPRERAALVPALERFNAAAGEVPEAGWFLGWA